jgi:hypothetical protein
VRYWLCALISRASHYSFAFVFIKSTLKFDYEYKKYMAGTSPPQSSIENPIVCTGADNGMRRPPIITAQSESNTIIKGPWLEEEDAGAISCDEDSFDEIFRSVESASLEVMTCPPFESEVHVDASTNTDATFPIQQQPVSSRHDNIPPEDRGLLRSYTQ